MADEKMILLVEDEAIIAMNEERMLRGEGYGVVLAFNGENAISIADTQPIDLILMDIDLGKGMDGTAAAQQILSKHDIPILFLSSHTSPEMVEKTEKITSYGYVVKNTGITVLAASIKMAFKLHAARRDLLRAHEKLSLALESGRAGTWDWDILNNTFDWSPEFYKLFGLDPAAEAGFPAWTAAVHPEDREAAGQRIQDALDAHLDLENEYRVILPGGAVRWIRATGKTYYQDGRPARMAGLCTDITELKQIEEARRKSEAKFRAVVENSYDGIIFAGADAIVTYRSPSYARINGFSNEERLGRSGLETIHPDDQPQVSAAWDLAIQHPGQPCTFEARLRHKDGSWRWVEATMQNLLDDPNLGQVLVAARDITPRKQAEEALRKSEARFRTLVENSNDGVIFCQADGTILFRSPSLTRINGFTFEERIGRSVTDVIHPQDREKLSRQ